MKVAFYTLGCKVNQYETNGMIQKFREAGYDIVGFSDFADIYIVNTCTVTSISDKKSRMFLRQAKKVNPKALVVAVGCYVQVASSEVSKIPEIDLCLGTNEKANIIEFINNYFKDKNENIIIDDVFQNKDYCEFGSIVYTEHTRAVIKIQDGCDRFCSYCMIPYARGRVRSRKPQSVIEEIKKIVENGIKEVVLTGIHIASYGKDFENKYNLIDLLEEINKIDGLKRIRLGSIEPLLITDEFISRLKKLEKVCHHFHLSLQSGCDETLKRMNRRYSIEEFRQIVNRIRNAFEDSILTTDIIVGFPGETDEEFELTKRFLEEIKFYKMHIFKYSVRKGTKAEKMPNQVEPTIKELRSNILIEMSDKNEKEYLESYVGKNIDVLFETNVNDNKELFEGFSSNYLKVVTSSKDDIKNKILTININKRDELKLYGNIIYLN